MNNKTREYVKEVSNLFTYKTGAILPRIEKLDGVDYITVEIKVHYRIHTLSTPVPHSVLKNGGAKDAANHSALELDALLAMFLDKIIFYDIQTIH